MSKAGVEAVPLAFPEVYSAAKTGIIEGFGMHTYLGPIFKYAEVSKYHIVDIELVAGAANGNFINLDAWAALPDDIKKIAIDAGKEVGEWGALVKAQEMRDRGFAYAEENTEVIHFPPEERAKLFELGMEGLIEGWIAEMEDKGLGDEARELVKFAEAKKAEIEATIK